jgi:hypothetical protein
MAINHEAPVLVDTPEAYSPILIIGQVTVRDAEAMQKLADKSRPDFNPDLLATEEQVLGVKVDEDPEAFRLAHNKLITGYAEYLAEVYPGVLDTTVHTLAAYMAKGDPDTQEHWEKTLRARAEAFSGIHAVDHLASGKVRGEMRPYSRSVLINSVYALMDPEEAQTQVEHSILPHEIIHLFSTSAVYVDAKDAFFVGRMNLPARTGINTMHLPNEEGEVLHEQGAWVNEAATEDLRGRAFSTNKLGYARGVALMRAFKELDPTLEETADNTVLGVERPAAMVERIEKILGPLGIERLTPFVAERAWNPVTKESPMKYDDETFIGELRKMLEPGVADQLEAAFRSNLADIDAMSPLPPHVSSYH